MKDNEGKSKGFGFVCFKDPKCAEIAYQNLQGKRIWEEIKNPLYVNFAMKKQERVEILKKERAEIYKNYQKLTVYVKIKDESKIVILDL